MYHSIITTKIHLNENSDTFFPHFSEIGGWYNPSFWEKLRKLPDGQLRNCFLQHCLAACRVTHLMRAKYRDTATISGPKLAEALREAITDIVGRSLTNGAWEQATISISKSGLGVRDPDQ